MTILDDNDTTPISERLERLRQWRDATSSDLAELILDRAIIAYMLDLIDDRPTYKPKTTPIHRAELYIVIREAGSGSAVDLLWDVLRDLDAAEAIIRGGGR